MSDFAIGDRVRVANDLFDDVLGGHNRIGQLGTVVAKDATDLLPVWVQLDADAKGDYSCFDADELEPANNYPTAKSSLVILDHLLKVGSISGIEAQNLYKCRALPRRIKDLKELGWNIVSHLRKDNTGQRYVRYELVRP